MVVVVEMLFYHSFLNHHFMTNNKGKGDVVFDLLNRNLFFPSKKIIGDLTPAFPISIDQISWMEFALFGNHALFQFGLNKLHITKIDLLETNFRSNK